MLRLVFTPVVSTKKSDYGRALTRLIRKWSVINSMDSSNSGSSGTGSKFSSWLLDGFYHISEHLYFRGYYGMMTYDDMNATTKDDVKVWKIEAKYPMKNVYIAGRISGW